MKLVLGLGNPGSRYAGTYHNVGYRALDRVLASWDHRSHSLRPGNLYEMMEGPVEFAGKPDCLVNRSGSVVRQWVGALEVPPDDLLVVYDDFSLDLGTVRLRPSGRSGGHKGLRSIINSCGTVKIPRLRIGIGPVPSGEAPEEFVLSTVTNSDRERLHPVLRAVPKILHSLEENGIDAAMSRWNGIDRLRDEHF